MRKVTGVCLLAVLLLTAFLTAGCPGPADEGTSPAPATSPVPGATTSPESPAGAPAVPHPVAGREDCLACHREGLKGANPIPENHSSFPNSSCLNCHRAGE